MEPVDQKEPDLRRLGVGEHFASPWRRVALAARGWARNPAYPPAASNLYQAAQALEAVHIPNVVCLCGSTRFKQQFEEQARELTLKGVIVLSVGFFTHADLGQHAEDALGVEVKAELDELHKRKIDLADCVLVLNVGGYVGSSTASEIAYAKQTGKPVIFLEPDQVGSYGAGVNATTEPAESLVEDL